MPPGMMATVHPRSGLASKFGLVCVTGIIDTGYRGEIQVTLINLGSWGVLINPGDRIAQLVFQPVYYVEFEPVQELSESERGEGGFGHTGV